MANCLYEPADCESERTVIISELEGGENDPDQLLDQELTATAFKAHPYRHPTIGWISDLRTMTRDDLYGYYRRYYIPNNATLVIVGDVETDVALRQVERYFGGIPSGPEPSRLLTVEPPQTGERRLTIRKMGTAAYLKAAFHAPAVTAPDFLALLRFVCLSVGLTLRCPQCSSADTEQLSRFGSTSCKSLWRCNSCKEPFDHFKAI